MSEPLHRQQLREMTFLGILAAGATAIQIIESPLPRLLPWLKPGLSNALVLYGIVRFSPWFGFKLVLLRTLLTGFFLGILFSPPNLLSLIGGCCAAAIMGIAHTWLAGWLSLYGISILGALANNWSQIFSLGFILGEISIPVWFQLLIMIWISVPSGWIVGKITLELLRRTA
jgi:heptaprenyl diphosphate synthase